MRIKYILTTVFDDEIKQIDILLFTTLNGLIKNDITTYELMKNNLV